MYISKKDWTAFVNRLSAINSKAGDAVREYITKVGMADVNAFIRYCCQTANHYGTASAALTALMYDTIAHLEGLNLPEAELADGPTYGDVAKAIHGTLKTSENAEELSGAIERLVKMVGQDTLIKNGLRDGAEFAWIPMGDTCAFCQILASRGWQGASKAAIKNGHATHIHSHCDCTYMVRHRPDFDVRGYEPNKYLEKYENASDGDWKAKMRAMRREDYAARKDEINAQKRAAYAKRKEADG